MLNSISSKRAEEILEQFSSSTIAVIGDLMLDTFTYGHITRMSPEAPVPVVHIHNEIQMLGGAGNVAVNAALLGATVYFSGRIGDDVEGNKIIDLFKKSRIGHSDILTEKNYTTIEKRRIIVDDHHVIRIDKENISNISSSLEKVAIDNLKKKLQSIDVIVLCDYAKGFLTETIAKNIIALAKENNIPVVVDTKPGRENWFKEVTLMTPNKSEAFSITKTTNIETSGNILQTTLNANILITQGPDGMSLFENKEIHHFPATETNVKDVSGAGDTVTATCALVIAAKGTLRESAQIANYAAGIAVSKLGTAAVHYKDLYKKIVL